MARASRGSRQQARTIAYALAGPLRGPAGRFEVGASRSHRVACKFLGNLYKIAPRSLPRPPGAHFGAPGAHFGPPRAHFGPPGAHFGPPGAHFGPPGPLLGLSWRSQGAPGSLWGAAWGLQNRSRRPSRRPPAQELDFEVILGSILAPFWEPKNLENQCFRVEGLHFSRKSRGSKKDT